MVSIEDTDGIEKQYVASSEPLTSGTDMSEAAVMYQLEKIDQGGDVQDMFEGRVAWLARELGWRVSSSGELVLPDGRWAGLSFGSYIRQPSEQELEDDEEALVEEEEKGEESV